MELGVMGMMLKNNPATGRRFTATRLVVLTQAALLLLWGAFANAQEGNRLQDIQVQQVIPDTQATLVLQDQQEQTA